MKNRIWQEVKEAFPFLFSMKKRQITIQIVSVAIDPKAFAQALKQAMLEGYSRR